MSKCQLYLPPEAAYNCVAELGELGIVKYFSSSYSHLLSIVRTSPVCGPQPRGLRLPAPIRQRSEEVRGDGENLEIC